MNTISSILFSSILLLWISLSLLTPVQSYDVYVRNKCNFKVQVATRIKSISSNEWFSLCWHQFRPGEGNYLGNNGEKIRTNNRIWYYYAETYDTGCDVEWRGSLKRTCRGRSLKMREYNYVDGDGDLYLALTCNTPKYSDRRQLKGNETDITDMEEEPPEELTVEDLIFKREHQKEGNPNCDDEDEDDEDKPWYCDGKSHLVEDDDGDKYADDEDDGDD